MAKYHEYQQARYEAQQAAALKKVCSEWEAKHNATPSMYAAGKFIVQGKPELPPNLLSVDGLLDVDNGEYLGVPVGCHGSAEDVYADLLSSTPHGEDSYLWQRNVGERPRYHIAKSKEHTDGFVPSIYTKQSK